MPVPTLFELMSCSSDGKRTVAESVDTGEPVHIADAVSGLACRCVCPGCGRQMVAHKGKQRQHFQHAQDNEGRTCTSSGETALHKFAKKTLVGALRLKLPGLKESDGRNSIDVVNEGDFVFDSAVLEKRQGEIVPDVVCRRGHRILYVEFLVTHACGPEKLARLRTMNVGAIEIDLSSYQGLPIDMLAEAILSEAPREWLHNPKITAAQSKLADMERKRVERIDAEARKLLVAAAEIASGDRKIGPWEEGAVAHGLKSVVAADGAAVGFLVREQEWKSFLVLQLGLTAKGGFTRKDAFAAVKAEDWIDKRFGFVGEDVADSMRRVTGRGVRVPWEAIGDFLTATVKSGMIMAIDRRGKLAGGKPLFDTVLRARELKERPQKRTEKLRDIVTQITSLVRKDFRDGFDFDAWLLPSGPANMAPATALVVDEEEWLEYLGRFERLRGEMYRRPPLVTDDLGLPVLEEVRARQEAHRLAEESRAREVNEKAEREAEGRVVDLRKSVELAMGQNASMWMEEPQDILSGLSPNAMARRSQADLWKAADALDRWKEAVREEGKRETQREKAIASLRAAARADFKRDDLADLWMRQPHRKLGGVRPADHCVDDQTLRACLDLLPGKPRR